MNSDISSWNRANVWARYQNLQPALPGCDFSFPWCMQLPLLNSAVDEAEKNIQAPRPLILTAALAAIATALQGLLDVRKPTGQCVPTSLMLLVVANSGERKSTAENIFFKPVRDFQQQQSVLNHNRRRRWQVQHDAWEAQRKAILKAISKEPLAEEHVRQLLAHDELRPGKPREFKLLYEDCTSEALFYGLSRNLPTAGLISSEGGAVLGARAFNDLPKQNAIWSGDTITVDRKSAESFELVGARLTVSIMAQESAISDYMERHGEQSRGSGLWARFLVSHPVSTQGRRFISNGSQSWGHCDKFAERMINLLQQNAGLLEEPGRERKVMQFTPEAAEHWLWVANAIESEIRPGGRFEGAGDHASKLADNIARVAALLHFFEGLNGDISVETLSFAISLCFWYSNEFVRLFLPLPQDQVDAYELNEWLNALRNYGQRYVRKNYIRQHCPNKLRESRRLNVALELLRMRGGVSLGQIGKTLCVDLNPSLPFDLQLAQLAIFGKL